MAKTEGPLDLSDYITKATNKSDQFYGRGEDMFKWGQDQFAKNSATTDKVVNQALDTGSTFMDWAKKDRNTYDTQYAPAMKEQLDYARGYTTPERMAANRAGAMAGVNISFDSAGDMAKRSLMGYGIDPASGRYAGLDAGLASKRAAEAAATGTESNRRTEMMGQQLLDNAINKGMTLPGQASNQAGVGLASGNQAVNAGLATTASGSDTMGKPLQWSGMGNDLLKEWRVAAQTEAGQRANEMELKRQEMASKESSGLGAALGAGAGILGMVGNFAMPGGGSLAGSLMSGLFSKAKRGGLIKKYADGGPVSNEIMDNIPDYIVPFDPEGEGYDYKSARDAGLGPEYNPTPAAGEPGMRWPGREPNSGLQLKGRRHPTFDHGVEHDRRMGYGLEKQNGRYYSQKFAGGGDVTDLEVLPDDDEEYVDTPDEEGSNLSVGSGSTPGVGDDPIQGDMVPPEASPSGGEETDDVHAMLNEGEFVIPKKVVSWKGEQFFQRLIEKAYAEMQQPKVAEPEMGPATAMAVSPPSFQSAGA